MRIPGSAILLLALNPMNPSPTTPAVHTQIEGDVLLVTIDHPPVNALNVDVRRGLLDAVRQAEATPQVRAVLIVGAGRAFIAGADIREFGKPPAGANLNDVIATMENCPKIVVAALQVRYQSPAVSPPDGVREVCR